MFIFSATLRFPSAVRWEQAIFPLWVNPASSTGGCVARVDLHFSYVKDESAFTLFYERASRDL